MKITFVLPNLSLSGGIRVVAVYADRLKQRGHEVFVVSVPKRSPTLRQQVRSLLKGKGWLPTPQPQTSHFDHLDVSRRVLECHRPVTDADVPDADVVIATWWETAEWVAQLLPAKGAKLYFIQHYEVFDYLSKERVEATYWLPMQKIAVAQWLVDLMAEKYGDRTIQLVPNAIDPKQFYAPPRTKQPIPTVGLMYSPAQWKGCDLSLKAVELARQAIPNLRLVAFGDTHSSDSLPLPVGTEYFYKAHQDVLRMVYSQCDVWLFGSRSEGFGLPILEAMACRTPVIGTPTGAAPELLADGAGVLVKSEDPEDMARAIAKVCQLSQDNWRRMSDMAYTRATSYTWDDACDRFEAVLVSQSSTR
jgi:glycosyltransferase involved in cell wall biosynthesis